MANFHSLDLRKRVVEYVLAGNQVIIASNLFQVSRITIYRWLDLVKKGNDLKPKQAVGRSGYKINHELICTHFAEKPDATLQEVADIFSTHPSAI
jgi:putative transposase